ncbi:hypothetical protein CCUS01_16100 [Colletotrichum cuscutae]|uniref:Uncharacterized protein n=1 Tax=Colletotrichum cuscutae TaxID=1209917 RepID=A0AAI9VDC2_9PEZI|nr:hypothetical protein CCUS01_16100 [Colletotrichum cuscutae]
MVNEVKIMKMCTSLSTVPYAMNNGGIHRCEEWDDELGLRGVRVLVRDAVRKRRPECRRKPGLETQEAPEGGRLPELPMTPTLRQSSTP